MEKVRLTGWSEIEDGMMGSFELSNGTPVNVCIDNYEELDDKEKENCSIEIFGVGQKLKFYRTKEEYLSSGTGMSEESMIPIGTFPIMGKEKDFEESPEILFTGTITEIDYDPEPKEGMPNVQMRISTYGMEFIAYWRAEEQIEAGYIVHGMAWLYGKIET